MSAPSWLTVCHGFLRGHFTDAGHRQRHFYRVNRDPRFVQLKGRLVAITRALIRNHLRSRPADATIAFEGRTLEVWTIGTSSSSACTTS